MFGEEADVGHFTESLERGCFRKALDAGGNVPMLYEHNNGLPLLASTAGGTLRLAEDAKGLKVEADVADTTLGRDLKVLADRGDIRGMSFGMVVGRGNARVEMRSSKPHRRIMNLKDLLDVSPTWDPVYRSAEGQFRSLTAKYAASPQTLRQLEAGAYPHEVLRRVPGGQARFTVVAARRRLNLMTVRLHG